MLGVFWALEYFRYYVYEKKVNLLTDHQALQLLLKRNRAHKQYSAGLTRLLDRLSHFDVNVQYSAGKDIPLPDYLNHHPIVHDHGTETSCTIEEKEAKEEFVINKIYGLFEFNRTTGSMTQRIQRPLSVLNSDQSRHSIQTCEQTKNGHSIQNLLPRSNSKPANIENFKINSPSNSKMDKVNGIDIEFIFKKRGQSQKQVDFALKEKKLSSPREIEL